MATSEEHLVILHGDDGEQWANFLSTRLSAQVYGIRSVIRNLSSGASSWSEKSARSNSESNNSSHSDFQQRDSGRGSRTISDLPIDSDCIDNSLCHVILLSPDVLNFPKFPFDITLLNHKRSVFLILGVEIDDVRFSFGKMSDYVFKCGCCIIQSTEKAISDALVEIIKAYEDQGDGSIYEDDESPYETPPSPRQINRIERVMPRELTGADRDVYFLLERAADDDLVVVLENHGQVTVTSLGGRLYMFTLPDHVRGEIFFKAECQNHCVGEDSVVSLSKLDQVKAILNEEVKPISLIASALGLSSDEIDSVDTALAKKLQQLSSLTTFQELFPCEAALNISLTEQRADVAYPTLLHFAADWNLHKFCLELLRYPDMLASALTENKDGEFPSTLASNKGYTQLESDLNNFVTDHKDSENDLYVHPTPYTQSSPAPPKPHSSGKTPSYVNGPPLTNKESNPYIYMTNLKEVKKSDVIESGSERSETISVSPLATERDVGLTRGQSFRCDDEDGWYSNKDVFDDTPVQNSRQPPSNKAFQVLGLIEKEKKISKTAGKTYTRPDCPPNRHTPGSIPHGVAYPAFSQITADLDRVSVSSNCDNPSQYGIYPTDPKHKGNVITAFFGKIKNKRSVSEGENVYVPPRGVKKTQSTRADKPKKKYFDSSNQERDSGSYSDEENGNKSSSTGKKNKPREFKERDKPMTRKRPLSKRVQIAKQERISDAPILPISHSRRGRFTSFVENF